MGQQYRWFKIGEANAEIERLEKALLSAEGKISAAESNDSEIAEQATALRKDRDALKSENDLLKGQISTLTTERDTARAEAKTAKDNADKATSDFEGKVKAEAAKVAVDIVASQGVKQPLKAEPADNPGAAKPSSPMNSAARINAFKQQIQSHRKFQGA